MHHERKLNQREKEKKKTNQLFRLFNLVLKINFGFHSWYLPLGDELEIKRRNEFCSFTSIDHFQR